MVGGITQPATDLIRLTSAQIVHNLVVRIRDFDTRSQAHRVRIVDSAEDNVEYISSNDRRHAHPAVILHFSAIGTYPIQEPSAHLAEVCYESHI